MNSFQPGKTDDLVKFFQDSVQVIYNIRASVIYMTGIQADAYFIPISLPFPAMVSRSTVVLCSGFKI